MKRNLNRKIATLMTVVLVLSFLFNMNAAVASAASPTFATKSIELVGEGKTYQMEIKNKVANSTYSWTTANSKIAKVSSKGLITAVSGGSTTIKCKITYPTKKTTTLSCKVAVAIPATAILINNKKLVNGAHVMKLGSSMDFNSDLTPKNSSDKVFWSIGGGDSSCIRIDSEKDGKITALKPGKVILRATAAKTATAADASLSIINDAVIVEVVGLTASVKSAAIVDDKKMVIEFDSAVDKSTVIAPDGSLSSNIEITLGRNLKNVIADDPGKLTPSLSSNGKSLTITSEKPFNGNYGVYFSNTIKTTDGIAIDADYKVLTFVDTIPPAFLNSTTDDTGRIVTINFTEPMNFGNMRISAVSLVTTTSGVTANSASINFLKTLSNYSISEDKTSMTINMTQISPLDYGKTFKITFADLKDLQGNEPKDYFIDAFVTTDKDNKPQAVCLNIKRTAYKTVTAEFDRAIQYGGIMQIAGGITINGVVDSTDNKKVNYTISDSEALYTGVKQVSIRNWNSYNVYPLDTSASSWKTLPVDFTKDSTSPILLENKFDTSTGILTLVYNKDVTLAAAAGQFSARFSSVTEDLIKVTLNYINVAHTEGNHIIKLRLLGLYAQAGIYTFDLNQGFVTDSFLNKSVPFAMLVDNTTGALSELPPPLYIAQKPGELSQITVRYAYKVDIASATSTANYVIPGIHIIGAKLENNSAAGAEITLTIADGAITQEMDYPIRISGVKGFNNTFTAITDYTYNSLHLKENLKPVFMGIEFDKVLKNNIKLNFNEPLSGTMQCKVTQTVGSNMFDVAVSSVNVVGNSIIIQLPGTIANNTQLAVTILSNNITDVSGNKLESVPAYLPLYVLY